METIFDLVPDIKEYGNGKRFRSATCPFCGTRQGSHKKHNPPDRFQVFPNQGKDGRGRYYCNNCQATGDFFDLYAYLHKIELKEAFQTFGHAFEQTSFSVRSTHSNSNFQRPEQEFIYPSEAWTDKAEQFLNKCKCRLKHDAQGQAMLLKRGIPLKAALDFDIGFNAKFYWLDQNSKIYAPDGLVFAQRNKTGKIHFMSVRRLIEWQNRRWENVKGSGSHVPFIYGSLKAPTIVITEAAPDALFVLVNATKFQSVICCIGLGGAKMPLPKQILPILQNKQVLLALDNDDAGTSGIRAIQKQCPNAIEWRVDKAYKAPGDMPKNKINDWLASRATLSI